jgi:hypothetical protein
MVIVDSPRDIVRQTILIKCKRAERENAASRFVLSHLRRDETAPKMGHPAKFDGASISNAGPWASFGLNAGQSPLLMNRAFEV